METFLIAIGLVAIFEGLVLALAPKRFEDVVRLIAEMPVESRRWLGLGFVCFGVAFIWLISVF